MVFAVSQFLLSLFDDGSFISKISLKILFLLSAVLWQSMYLICNCTVSWIVKSATSLSKKQALKLNDLAPSYLVSSIHAIWATAMGYTLVNAYWDVPFESKIVTIGHDGPFHHLAVVTARIGMVLAAYLSVDLFWVLHMWPRLGKIDTLCHHGVFLVSIFTFLHLNIFPELFGWLILCEASTPVVNFRWMLINTGLGNGKLMKVTVFVMGIAFFLLRCVGYGYALFVTVSGDGAALAVLHGRPASIVWGGVLLLAAGWVLQLVWFFIGIVPIMGRCGAPLARNKKRI